MKKSKGKTLNNIISLICILLIIISIGGIIWTLYPRFLDMKKAKEIQEIALPEDTNTIDWEALKRINPDVVGWIQIPGTHINYPVVQTTDNDYYLLHSFENEVYGYGTPFLDYTYDFNRQPKAQNAVIYAHSSHYGDQVGFEGLNKYQDENYLKEHPTLYYTTIYDGNTPVEYEIVGILKEEAHFDYRRPDFADQNDFLNYYNTVLSHEYYPTGKKIYADDQLVTLSTCVFDIENGRVAVVARRKT